MKKNNKSFEFDYEEVKNKALAQLKTGKPLLGKDGALAPLFQSFLEAALEAELENHRQIRKVTKTKGAFTNDMALLKLVYLASQRIMEKWTQPLKNWALTIQQLSIMFEERMPKLF